MKNSYYVATIENNSSHEKILIGAYTEFSHIEEIQFLRNIILIQIFIIHYNKTIFLLIVIN